METRLADFIKNTPDGIEADSILRKCVHCGFCTATCPTYTILGDERDSPRGRIYLIKEVLEGGEVGPSTRLHLDRCLTCRNCESTCPSGVQYGRLVDIGRKVVETRVAAPRPLPERVVRLALREGLTRPALFGRAMRMGQRVRGLLPGVLRDKVPQWRNPGRIPNRSHASRMIMLEGCVQPSMAPSINAATRRVFDALGIELLAAGRAGCCGAIRQHLADPDGALDDARRNIDAWIPLMDRGAETIVINASGCGVTIKEYGHLLRHDPMYAQRAERVANAARDIGEVLALHADELVKRAGPPPTTRVAYHPPCTLQHGQSLRGQVESLLARLGIDVATCAESHLCCGSAGTYSILQSRLSHALRDRKISALEALDAEVIVSSNIGCISHLQAGTHTPVRHWIELVDNAIAAAKHAV